MYFELYKQVAMTLKEKNSGQQNIENVIKTQECLKPLSLDHSRGFSIVSVDHLTWYLLFPANREEVGSYCPASAQKLWTGPFGIKC